MDTSNTSTTTLTVPIPFPAWVLNPLADVTSLKKIPRPRNKFLVYRNHMTATRKALRNQGNTQTQGVQTQGELSQIIGNDWHSLNEEAQRPYAEAAAREKAAHKLRWPHYRYHPQSKEEKAAAKVAANLQKQAEKALQEEDRLTTKRAHGSAPYTVPQRRQRAVASLPDADVDTVLHMSSNADAGPSQLQPAFQNQPALMPTSFMPPPDWWPAPQQPTLPGFWWQPVGAVETAPDVVFPMPAELDDIEQLFAETDWANPRTGMAYYEEPQGFLGAVGTPIG
ncbi:hypothetical protein EWM64_g2691 [Hericium alpestre]|uniref:HMG box domain-containing protein n=1 Tax=Hericium alpestre TaxID=135208 RepID=A0A4Z0A4D2_9AGAM|nr:hypothetical protein EWM64_g2691 [Hericium alpestre]